MSKFIENTFSKIGRTATEFRCLLLLLLPMMICSFSVHAEYSFQVVIPPEADYAQASGINNAGKVVGNTEFGEGPSFMYDMKRGEYTVIDEMVVYEISNSGVMVGRVGDGVCAIRDKGGNITTFSPPSMTDDSGCEARGVNPDGQVSGYEIDEFGNWLGFIYDSEYDTYEEFLPSWGTLANAINAQGQNVGSVYLFADEAYPGSPEGFYGYLRQEDGSVKYFAINQSYPGETRARGISENGLVTGWYLDPETFEYKAYVTTLSKGTGFEAITLTDDQMLYQKPCDSNIPPPPEPDWVLYTDMTTSQIRNDGVIVGMCSDYYVDEDTWDWVEYHYGFIATPMK